MEKIKKQTSFKSTAFLVVLLWIIISACDGSSCNVSTSKQTGKVIDKIENQTVAYNSVWSDEQAVLQGA